MVHSPCIYLHCKSSSMSIFNFCIVFVFVYFVACSATSLCLSKLLTQGAARHKNVYAPELFVHKWQIKMVNVEIKKSDVPIYFEAPHKRLSSCKTEDVVE